MGADGKKIGNWLFLAISNPHLRPSASSADKIFLSLLVQHSSLQFPQRGQFFFHLSQIFPLGISRPGAYT
jgi:hypothetical protein